MRLTRTLSAPVVGATLLAGLITTAAPSDAAMARGAGTPKPIYTARLIDPDTTVPGSNGVDLTDAGMVLATDGYNSYVVARRTTRLRQPGQTAASWLVATSMNNAGRVFGMRIDASGMYQTTGYVEWPTPQRAPVVVCQSLSCPIYGLAEVETHTNAAGNTLLYYSQPAGETARLVTPDGTDTAVPGVDQLPAMSSFTGLSDDNQVVGIVDGLDMPFVITAGVVHWLANLPGASARSVDAISSSGTWIVGTNRSATQYSAVGQTVVWGADRVPHALAGAPTGFVPVAINDNGWVIGSTSDGAWLVHDGHATPLSQLAKLPKGLPAGARLCSATDLNDGGQVLARTCPASDGATYAVLLTPRRRS